jgi:hypothetical protein
MADRPLEIPQVPGIFHIGMNRDLIHQSGELRSLVLHRWIFNLYLLGMEPEVLEWHTSGESGHNLRGPSLVHGGYDKLSVLTFQGVGAAGEADASFEFLCRKQTGFLGPRGRHFSLENAHLAFSATAIATARRFQSEVPKLP